MFLVSLFFSLKIYGRATSRAIIDIFSYGYWAILFGFFLIYFYESFSARYYDRYHRYRAFAEGLRVQIGWLLAGIQRPVMDHYWNHQISELDWLRMTLRSVMIPIRYDGHVFISQSREYWLKSQRDWMCERIRKQRQVSRRHERIAWIFIGLALLWSIARIRIAELMNTFYGMCDILWCRLLASSLIVIFSLSGVIAAIGFYTRRDVLVATHSVIESWCHCIRSIFRRWPERNSELRIPSNSSNTARIVFWKLVNMHFRSTPTGI